VSIVNRRNAVLGWSVWQVSKGVAKRKAKSAKRADKSGPGMKSLVAASAAGAVGALTFWRRRRGGESSA
jgi:MYXO-CTERM domain-containing protein